VTADDVRAFARTLPRNSEGFVRGQVKLRIGRIVYVALSRDGTTLGLDEFALPRPSDLRYHWVDVRLAAIDMDQMRELVEDAWAFCVSKRVAEEYAACRASSSRRDKNDLVE
jgi:hypothetical protein